MMATSGTVKTVKGWSDSDYDKAVARLFHSLAAVRFAENPQAGSCAKVKVTLRRLG
jgi:hypothetical protein